MSAQSCPARRTRHGKGTDTTSPPLNNIAASPACYNQIQQAISPQQDLLILNEPGIFILGPHDFALKKPQQHQARLSQAEPYEGEPSSS